MAVQLEDVWLGNDTAAKLLSEPIELGRPGAPGVLMATGDVESRGAHEISFVFSSAIAAVDETYVSLAVSHDIYTVRHDAAISEDTSHALVVELDLDRSVVATDSGYAFAPMATRIWSSGQADIPPARTTDENQSASQEDRSSRPPQQYYQAHMDREAASDTRSSSATQTFSRNPRPSQEESPEANESRDTRPPRVNTGSPCDASTFTGAVTEVIVQYDEDARDKALATLSNLSATLLHTFDNVPALLAVVPEANVPAMRMSSSFRYVEVNRGITFSLDTSRQAIQSPPTAISPAGWMDADGRPLDGTGIGVAVIDSGIDASHPDLPYGGTGLSGVNNESEPTVVRNFRVMCPFAFMEARNTDGSGHGSHVAGIIAGQGRGNPSYQGVAPGADLYGFGVGAGGTLFWMNMALDWIAGNWDQVDPPIRVVSNSWSTGTEHDPNALSTRLVDQLVDEGIVVVFAAGNRGGDGRETRTSAESQNPFPGVISVAAYDDEDAGTRDGDVARYSSRGDQDDPLTWPDLMAPGSRIVSVRGGYWQGVIDTVAGSDVNGGLYRKMSGTSMAAPHVSGATAILLQANPNLSPAQVEGILEATAYKSSGQGSSKPDGGGTGAGAPDSAAGYGLLDVGAAVALALETRGAGAVRGSE